VMQLSALKGSGLAAFWDAITRFRDLQTANGLLASRRAQQVQAWMWSLIDAGLKQRFKAHPAVTNALPPLTADVHAGRVAASVAARRLLDLFS
jgi:LAO/AO transport system kinase